jgi:flagellar hook-associated protein 2
MASSIGSTSSTASAASTALSSLTAGMFQASGLASGLNTSSIIDALISADSGRLNALKQKQSDYQVQISTMGTLVTQLQAMQTAADGLSKNGVVAIQPSSTYSDFSVTGSAKAEGSYSIQVSQLAQEAKLRSTSFSSAQDASVVPQGTLQFSIDGTNTVAIDTTGKGLADIAQAINDNISGLNASVISTSSGYYLNVARKTTGYATTANAALTVVSDPGLGLTTQQAAQNAQISIDGLPVTRTSNAINDVIPGVTLNLTGKSGVSNNVSFVANSSGTEAALNGFVTAYNTLATTLHNQLVQDPTQSYGDTLLSHTTTAGIESAMQGLLSKTVVASGSVRTLADLGLVLKNDGTLMLNTITMNNAIASNPSAVNAIFSQSQTGIGDTVDAYVNAQTNASNGALTLQTASLNSSISQMTDEESGIQSYLDSERARLVAQFTNMETLIAGYNSSTTYLTQISSQKSGG